MLIELQAAVQSLKLGTDIVRGVIAADRALNEADLKLKLADLMGLLADARVAVVEAGDRLAERDAEIAKLQQALRNKQDVVKKRDAYYSKNAEGQASGAPYCLHCFEVDHLLVHVPRAGKIESKVTCPRCKNQYERGNAPII